MSSITVPTFAKYEQENPSKLPTLTKGKITPQTLYRFEKGCLRYFSIKSVTEDTEKIVRIMAGIRDPSLGAWFDSNNAHLITLSFIEFIKALRKQVLDTDWESSIRRQMAVSKYTLNLDFQNWADNIVFLNCLLDNSDQKLDEKGLLSLLKTNLDDKLDWEVQAPRNCVRSENLKEWMEDVRGLAEDARIDIKRVREYVDEVQQRSVKRQAATSISSRRPRAFGNATNTIQLGSRETADCCPALTADKRTLLNAHRGCFKCRSFYSGHFSNACPNGFLDGKTYVLLT
ncbi:hypothetical protein M378DRAFT_91285, partial [Amanita muscaria Koide BX008]